MRYLVKARVKPGREKGLLQAIADGTLGQGSIAGDEYVYDLQQARVGDDGVAHWVETCFCDTSLAEERPYWEKYFELLSVKDAHNRKNCRHENSTEPWACSNCDCTNKADPFSIHCKTGRARHPASPDFFNPQIAQTNADFFTPRRKDAEFLTTNQHEIAQNFKPGRETQRVRRSL